MKNQHFRMAVMVCLLSLTPLVSAADRAYRQDTGHYIAERWKLGEPNRNGYTIYAWHNGYWKRMPGSAVDIGQGWVIGTDRRHGGYGIYRWNGYDWGRVPGAAISIGGSYERPWVINDRGEKFYWNGRDWDRERGYRNNNDRSYNGNTYRERDPYRGQGRGRNRRRGW